MKNAVVEEIEELGKRILSGDSSLRRKPNLCSVHRYRRTCKNSET
jgi:hypothetical protein